jgi:hypothetical protein
MGLIAALVLAAAGPTLPAGGPGGHAPAALVLIVDNSLSSAAIVDGSPLLEQLRGPARRVLDRAGAGDRLWLLTADGIPRLGDPAVLAEHVEQLVPQPLRMDLGQAIATGRALLGSTPLPGEIVLLTDLQASAVGAGSGEALLVGVPDALPPPNRGVALVETGPQPWGASGRVTTSIQGSSSQPAAVTLSTGDRVLRQQLLPPGGTGSVALTGLPPGWHALRVEMDPDELRLDDQRQIGVRVAAPVAATWAADGSHLADAMAVLLDNGRVARGGEVLVDRLGGGASILFPPEDPAALGAINRALVAQGSGWQFGAPVATPASTDSNALLVPQPVVRRHRLEALGGGGDDVLIQVGGEPWLVRSGTVLLAGSRFDPAWTGLPLSAAFMPFMDLLLNRLARGEAARLVTATGEAVVLPSRVTAVSLDGVDVRVEGGAPWKPGVPGLHWLLVGADTIGVVEAHHDPRESELARALADQVRQLWPGVELVTPVRASEAAFGRTGRADLRTPLLWLAVILGAAELLLAGLRRRG